MSTYRRIREQQILREAEGYLDLLMVLSDRWPPSCEVRDRLAQRALETLRQLQCKGKRRAHRLYLMGQALLTMERHAEAIELLQQAADRDSGNIHIWLALGWCHKRTDRLDLAIQALEEALAIDPSEAIIYYNLACYWSLAGNAKLALAYLSRALEIDPDYRDQVASEPDFDPIRNHPKFQTLTSVIV